jgi:hypothetical protein
MKLEEAVKLQYKLVELLPEVGFYKYIASTRLGIEALKLVQKERRYLVSFTGELLPGETEE